VSRDTLSDVLRTVRLRGAVFYYIDGSPPWVAEAPPAREIIPGIMPGAEHMGILITGVLGVAGSFLGGLIARIFSKPPEGAPFHPAGIILSIVGALILLFLWNRFAA